MQTIYIDGNVPKKSCLQMALNDMKIFMNLKKNSQKTKLIKMMKDNFSKLMFNNL